MEFVSVVIPLFNKAEYIRRAVDSVTAQTYPYFELLVVDDGSTDGGAQIAACCADGRIRIVEQSRGGVSKARNTGIMEAKYSLIAFLDADDEWTPDFLETVTALHSDWPQAGIYATAYEIEYGGRVRRARIRGIKKFRGIIPDYFRSVLGDFPVISSAVMIRRGVFESIGMFEAGSRLGEDQDMWCRIAVKYAVAYCNQACAVYHLGTHNSICLDTSVIEEYPVMRTIEGAMARDPRGMKNLKPYLCKLRLDYAVRLIRAGRLCEAARAIIRAGWRLPEKGLIAAYYLFAAAVKKLLLRFRTHC